MSSTVRKGWGPLPRVSTKDHIDIRKFTNEVHIQVLDLINLHLTKFINIKVHFELFGHYIQEAKCIKIVQYVCRDTNSVY